MSTSSPHSILPEDVQRHLCHFLGWETLQRWALCAKSLEALLYSSRHAFQPDGHESWDTDAPRDDILLRLTNLKKLSLSDVDFDAIPDDLLNRFGNTVTNLEFDPSLLASDEDEDEIIDRMPVFKYLTKLAITSCSPKQIKKFILEHITAGDAVECLRIEPLFSSGKMPKNLESSRDLAEFCSSQFPNAKTICWGVPHKIHSVSPSAKDCITVSIAPFSKCSKLQRISVSGGALETAIWHALKEAPPSASAIESVSRIQSLERSIWSGPGEIWEHDSPAAFYCLKEHLGSPEMWEAFLSSRSLKSLMSSRSMLKMIFRGEGLRMGSEGLSIGSLRVLLAHGLDLATPIAPKDSWQRSDLLLHCLIERFVEDTRYFKLVFFTPLIVSSRGETITPFEYCRQLHPGFLFSNMDSLFAKVLSIETSSKRCLRYLLSKGSAIAALAPDDPKFVGSFNEPDPRGIAPMERCRWIKGDVVAFAVKNGAEVTPALFSRIYFDSKSLQVCLEKRPSLLLQVMAETGTTTFAHILRERKGATEPPADTISVFLDYILSPKHPELASVATNDDSLLAIEQFLCFYIDCQMEDGPGNCSEDKLADVIRRLILFLQSQGRLKNACRRSWNPELVASAPRWCPRWSPPDDPLYLASDAICEVELEHIRNRKSGGQSLLLNFAAPEDAEILYEAEEYYFASRFHKIDVACRSSLFKEVLQEWKKAGLKPLHTLVKAGIHFARSYYDIVPEPILSIIKVIVEAGYPSTDLDSQGKTPLQWAEEPFLSLFESALISKTAQSSNTTTTTPKTSRRTGGSCTSM